MRKLNRYSEHRMSMLRNLCISLIKNGRIVTTLERAKELRSSVEKLITKAKEQNLHSRRILLSRLNNNNEIVDKLFSVGNRNKDCPGGYTRILKFGYRSDGGKKALIQIIDYPVEVKDDQGNK